MRIHIYMTLYISLSFYHIAASVSAGGEGEDLGVHLKLLSLLENPAVIVAAAASGDIATLKDYLSKHPRDVRVLYNIVQPQNTVISK